MSLCIQQKWKREDPEKKNLQINTLQDTATHCNTLQHTATHCNTLQHTAPHCDTIQHTSTHTQKWRSEDPKEINSKFINAAKKNKLADVALILCANNGVLPNYHDDKGCNTLQHTATHRNALQRTATHCNTLRHPTMHCNTLQHTATHCITLQHTATWR